MDTYDAGHWLKLSPNFSVLPLYVDHSALDAYTLCIKAGGKKILFTGDFQAHGTQSGRGQLWAALEKFFPADGSRDAQLIYSMWTGYLNGSRRDEELLKALGGRKPVPLHTSGHA